MNGSLARFAGPLGSNPIDVPFSGRSSVPALLTTRPTAILMVMLVTSLPARSDQGSQVAHDESARG